MTSLLSRLFGRRGKGSGATAKNRLHFVLQHDRINLPPERLEEMKSEILEVIAKYLVVDKERVEIALEQRDRTHSKLVAEIPFHQQQTLNTDTSRTTDSTIDEAVSSDADNGADTETVEENSKAEKADVDADSAGEEEDTR